MSKVNRLEHDIRVARRCSSFSSLAHFAVMVVLLTWIAGLTASVVAGYKLLQFASPAEKVAQ